MQLTKDISFELITNSTGYPKLVPQNRIQAKPYLANLQSVAEIVQIIIDFYKAEAILSSGFRGTTLNTAVGSKSLNSQHIYGEAVDFALVGISPARIYADICEKKIPGLPYDKLSQVILEKYKSNASFKWVHIAIFTERFRVARALAKKDASKFQKLVTEDSAKYNTYAEYKPKLDKLLVA